MQLQVQTQPTVVPVLLYTQRELGIRKFQLTTATNRILHGKSRAQLVWDLSQKASRVDDKKSCCRNQEHQLNAIIVKAATTNIRQNMDTQYEYFFYNVGPSPPVGPYLTVAELGTSDHNMVKNWIHNREIMSSNTLILFPVHEWIDIILYAEAGNTTIAIEVVYRDIHLARHPRTHAVGLSCDRLGYRKCDITTLRSRHLMLPNQIKNAIKPLCVRVRLIRSSQRAECVGHPIRGQWDPGHPRRGHWYPGHLRRGQWDPSHARRGQWDPGHPKRGKWDPATRDGASGTPATRDGDNGTPATRDAAIGSLVTRNAVSGTPVTRDAASGTRPPETQPVSGTPAPRWPHEKRPMVPRTRTNRNRGHTPR